MYSTVLALRRKFTMQVKDNVAYMQMCKDSYPSLIKIDCLLQNEYR